MDYTRLIEGIVANFDLRSELDRRKAFRECVRFAEDTVGAEEFTEFIRQAAELLGQQKQFEQIVNPLIDSSGEEKLHLRFDENEGAQLVGNAQGLLYLSKVLRNLSQAKNAGEYVYFYCGEAPMDINSIPLAVYLEDEAYFAELDQEFEESYDQTQRESEKRKPIDAKDIAAFFITGNTSKDLPITPMKVYKVLSAEEAGQSQGDMVMFSDLFLQRNRIAFVIFRRDDGGLMRLALDLDDEAVGFITKEEWEQLYNG